MCELGYESILICTVAKDTNITFKFYMFRSFINCRAIFENSFDFIWHIFYIPGYNRNILRPYTSKTLQPFTKMRHLNNRTIFINSTLQNPGLTTFYCLHFLVCNCASLTMDTTRNTGWMNLQFAYSREWKWWQKWNHNMNMI